jgi:hypothetical protein
MLTLTTELDAINSMLSSIGESPVSTVDDSGVVDVVMARQILSSVNREVQSRGWHFNTEKGIQLNPSFPNKELVLPANTLRVDSVLEDAHIDVVQRGTRLYDRTNHTYAFDKSMKVDLVVLLAFEELPETARQYITIRASRIFQERTLGAPELSSFNSQDELFAKIAMLEADADTADYNMLTDSYSVARVLDR